MNINRIAKTFRCVGRSFQGMEVWKKPNCWGKIISKKILQGQKARFYTKQKIVIKEIYKITILIILTLKIAKKLISWAF